MRNRKLHQRAESLSLPQPPPAFLSLPQPPTASWLGTYSHPAQNLYLLWTSHRAWCKHPNLCLGNTALIPETQAQQKLKFSSCQ